MNFSGKDLCISSTFCMHTDIQVSKCDSPHLYLQALSDIGVSMT